MTSIIRLEDRFVGAVVGSAIGDALGYPVEFKRIPGGSGVVKTLPHHGANYSDDTQMSVAVMRGLIASQADGKVDDPDAVAKYVADFFVKWRDHPEEGSHRAPGGACMAGVSALSRGVPWRESGGMSAGGCGSVMRSYPYGLWHCLNSARAWKLAASHSQMTHRHPGALAASAAQAMGIWANMRDWNPRVVVGAMAGAAAVFDEKTSHMILEADYNANGGEVGPREVLEKWEGWNAWEAIAASVYCFASFPMDFEKAVLLAVNSPGDSDSLGAITGALMGARHGVQGIPEEWRNDVERSAELHALAREFWHASGAPDVLYKMESE